MSDFQSKSEMQILRLMERGRIQGRENRSLQCGDGTNCLVKQGLLDTSVVFSIVGSFDPMIGAG